MPEIDSRIIQHDQGNPSDNGLGLHSIIEAGTSSLATIYQLPAAIARVPAILHEFPNLLLFQTVAIEPISSSASPSQDPADPDTPKSELNIDASDLGNDLNADRDRKSKPARAQDQDTAETSPGALNREELDALKRKLEELKSRQERGDALSAKELRELKALTRLTQDYQFQRDVFERCNQAHPKFRYDEAMGRAACGVFLLAIAIDLIAPNPVPNHHTPKYIEPGTAK